MQYTIYHGETTLPSGGTAFGLEVQPPLGQTAEAIAKLLAEYPEGFTTGRDHLAESAVVTRNDVDGTAFIVTPNWSADLSSARVAMALGRMIDPVGRHEVVLVRPIPE